jgi:hypothetical protein
VGDPDGVIARRQHDVIALPRAESPPSLLPRAVISPLPPSCSRHHPLVGAPAGAPARRAARGRRHGRGLVPLPGAAATPPRPV